MSNFAAAGGWLIDNRSRSRLRVLNTKRSSRLHLPYLFFVNCLTPRGHDYNVYLLHQAHLQAAASSIQVLVMVAARDKKILNTKHIYIYLYNIKFINMLSSIIRYDS
jgi:hypothetical protein